MRWAAVLLVLATLVGCTSDEPHPPAAPVAAPTTPPSPFTVGWVPDGFAPTAFGRGIRTQGWDIDETGTDEPFTVLTNDADELVVVSTTGYAGYQGGLDQASVTSCCGDNGPPVDLTVDGKRAILAPPHRARRTAELLVAVTPEVAVRVIAPGWGRDRLIDLVRRTAIPKDHQVAPAVSPPDGWRVLGGVDAPLLLAATTFAPSSTFHQDGRVAFDSPEGSWAATWTRGSDVLLVATVPGTDPTPLVGLDRWPWRTSSIDQREGGVVLHRDHSTAALRRRAGGDLVVVVSSYQSHLTADELWRVAGTVRSTTDPAWAQARAAAWGAPPKVDAGEVEALRGSRPGYDWLLQAHSAAPLVPGAFWPHDCLKLSTFEYACSQAVYPKDATLQFSTPHGDHAVVVQTRTDAVAVRITDAASTQTARFTRLPGEVPNRVAVLFGPGYGVGGLTCEQPGGPLPNLKVELLDTAGRATCVHF
ncbi:MAG: hypothetical protein JWN67_3771 [Actinomycetia bacterium]|nr:hypothetical protein [Actinomycetes bacterium]